MNSQLATRLAVLAALVIVPASALAQASPEAVPTATGDGYVDPDAKMPGPGPVRTVPAAKTLYKGPLDRLASIPRSNILSNVHGSVGVMVGTHNTRAAYANMYGPLGDHASFAVNFATVHSDALPFYDGGYGGYGEGYGGGYGYRDASYPSGAAVGYDQRSRSGYGYGAGTGYSVGASLHLGDTAGRYDRVWPNYAPPLGSPRGEETTDVTDEPLSSSE